MAFLPPPPVANDPSDPAFRDWFYKLQQYLANVGNIAFTSLDFTGSNITSIETRHHNDLQEIQGSVEGYHLSSVQYVDLTDGGDTTLHYHASDRDLANATGTLSPTLGGTGQTVYSTGDLLFASGTSSLSLLNIGTEGQVLTVTSGVPSWQDASGGGGSGKIYEMIVLGGFNDNIAYAESEPKVPNFLTTVDGDIMMAWGGDYAS